MIPLFSFLIITAIGVLGFAAIITVSPNLTGVITSALVLAITVATGGTVALLIREAFDAIERRRPRHLKPGRVRTFIDGDGQ